MRPDYADAHYGLGWVLLLMGRLEEGWREYEWRWKTKPIAATARQFTVPQWNGESIGDRTLLLHAEQGLSDTLQFCRYVPLIPDGAKIVLEVQPSLERFLSQLPGVAALIPQGAALPPFDLHCPLLSLPLALGTILEGIPAAVPYLKADPMLAARWGERIAHIEGLRVGIVWAGQDLEELMPSDRSRSTGLAMMEPLGEVSGVSFISLQQGEAATQRANPPYGMVLYDFTADLQDFADTAALIDRLDLVITVDTAVAHLAGALDKPVWLLNRFDPHWRWLLDRDDSPWYPQLLQFRQSSPGDWTSVVLRVRDALQLLANGDRSQFKIAELVVSAERFAEAPALRDQKRSQRGEVSGQVQINDEYWSQLIAEYGADFRLRAFRRAPALGCALGVVDYGDGPRRYRCLQSFDSNVGTINPQGPKLTSMGRMDLLHPAFLLPVYERLMSLSFSLCEQPATALLLGVGGASMPRFISATLPKCKMTLVDADEVVIGIARRWFHLNQAVTIDTAQAFMAGNAKRFDVILVDAYAGSDPAAFGPEFWSRCIDSLAPAGCMASNWFNFEANKAVQEMAETQSAVARSRGFDAYYAYPRVADSPRENVIQYLSTGKRRLEAITEAITRLAGRGVFYPCVVSEHFPADRVNASNNEA